MEKREQIWLDGVAAALAIIMYQLFAILICKHYLCKTKHIRFCAVSNKQ